MSFAAYPTPADVENLMRSTGYWPTDSSKQVLAGIQAQIGAEAAKDEWEHLTGWTPFLADAEPSPRFFDQVDSRGLLNFDAGAISITSVTVAGNALVSGQSYHASPVNAIAKKEAYTGVQLGYRGSAINYYSRPNQIEVVARWGRVVEVPGDVYQAILQKAALIVLTQIENLQSVASISQDGFNKSYDIVGIVTQKDLVTGVWSKDFEKIAMRWMRVVS